MGIVHRDLKLANIITHNGKPVIIDLGMAVKLAGNTTSLGSPYYMAP